MKIKAVAFDMDDTLLRDDRTISAYTTDVLRRAADCGICVIPASGRAKDSMRGFVQQLGCAACYIACNGAEVWDAKTHECLMRETLDVPLARSCGKFAREFDCYAQCYYGAHFYYSKRSRYAAAYAASSLLTGEFVGDLDAYITDPTTKILMMDEDEKIAAMLPIARERFAGLASVTCSKSYFLEINPLLATKGNALRWAGERLGFELSEAMTFGDSLNDLSMLTAAGIGVAMGNAREDVKQIISRVCLTNEQDGVAHYIEAHLLREESV